MSHRTNSVTRLTDENGLFAGIVIPGKDHFKGVLPIDEIETLNKEHLPMLGGISKLEQWSDWNTGAIEVLNEQVVINSRQRKAERSLGLAALKWVVTITGAGFVSWLFSKLK